MDYEVKYNKLVEAVKELQESNPHDKGLQNWVNDNVPELKWSEDDRMRGAIYYYIGGFIGRTSCAPKGEYSINDMLAWIEKQGIKSVEERARYNIGDVICDKSCTTLNKEAQPNMEIIDIRNGMYICDKGSFPVSQQDEYELVSKKIDTKLNDDSVSNELREASFTHARNEMMSTTCPNNMTFEFAYNFEEGAKWYAAHKHTWCEEDEEMLNLIIKRLHSHADVDLEEYSKEYDWLNSLEDRFTWMPSDEQMDALQYVYKNLNPPLSDKLGWDSLKTLELLYQDLKKLL